MSTDTGPEGPWPCLCNERSYCWCRAECEAEQKANKSDSIDAMRYRKWREAHIDPIENHHILRGIALADTASAVDKALDKAMGL